VTTGKSLAVVRGSSAHKEGRFAIVTKRGAEDAVDAAAQATNALFADGEAMWS
jgi:Ni,Fe-hydrogenase I small subunit